MAKIPPFYENFDNTHCVQCVLRSVLGYFEPDVAWTWDELDEMTGKEPGKWTWHFRYPFRLIERGYDIQSVGMFNLQDYVDKGIYQTLVDNLGVEAANRQREMANLDNVWEDFQRYYDAVKQGVIRRQQRLPTRKDIESFLDKGFLVHVSLNSRVLSGREGYSSHAVLVYRATPHFVFFHDSGLPPVAERRVSWKTFLKACTSPTLNQFGITAYRRNP